MNNMKDSFIFEGKKYISARRASEISKYASDYIGQLCRANKLDCRMIGRSWFVTEESLYLHKATISREDAGRSRIDNLRGKKLVSVPTFAPTTEKSDNVNGADQVKLISSPFTPSVSKSTSLDKVEGLIISPIKNDVGAKPISINKYSNDDRPLLPTLKQKSQDSLKRENFVRPSKVISDALSHDIQEFLNLGSKKVLVEENNPDSILKLTSSPVLKLLSAPKVEVLTQSIPSPIVVSVKKENQFKGHVLTYSKLAREIILKRVLAPTVVLLLFFGVGTGTYLVADRVDDAVAPRLTKSVQVASAGVSKVADSVFSAFMSGYRSAVAFFTSPARLALDTTSPKEFLNVTVSEVNTNGIVLTSSSGSDLADELAKQKIKDSFSDEVEVSPDKSGTAGVITPVFKNTNGKDFVYVMVPVKDRNSMQ